MARVVIRGGELDIELGTWEGLLSLHDDVAIDVGNIESIEAVPFEVIHPRGLRLPGTGVPGLVHAGTYVDAQGREFWAVVGPHPMLVIECSGGDWRRVAVGMEDAEAQAEGLRRQILGPAS
ncbi:MAG TPA: hypothetical protein VF137_09210 [Candidatus Dormibacteraeota bacterium]